MWQLKIHKIVYILAGKIQNKPFICVDKVRDYNPNNPIQDKIYYSISNPDIVLTVVGSVELINLIMDYDYNLYQQGLVLNITEKLINEFAITLEAEYDYQHLKDNYIYVIDKNTLIRYDLRFPPNESEYSNCILNYIDDGYFMHNMHQNINFIPISYGMELFSDMYLKRKYIERYNRAEEKLIVDDYFKEGFTFFTK